MRKGEPHRVPEGGQGGAPIDALKGDCGRGYPRGAEVERPPTP